MTGRDLISASLRLIGAIAPGESPTSAEATDGLSAINRMIDSWSNESLMVYSKTREVFSLVAGDASYTIGTGGNFNTTRPQNIDAATLLIGTVEYPLKDLSESEWASVAQKGISAKPHSFYMEGTYPLETINLYPTPSAADSIVLYAWKPITQISTLDTTLSLPPGYERALVYNGALELSSEYGRQVTEIVFNIANESKATLKRMNFKPGYLRVDSALVSKKRFNIITGDYNR